MVKHFYWFSFILYQLNSYEYVPGFLNENAKKLIENYIKDAEDLRLQIM